MNSITKTCSIIHLFPEQNIMYWRLHLPPLFSCLIQRRIRNLLKYLYFVFIYVAENRKSENRRVTDPSANQQRVVQLVIKMAAVKEEYYKDPHYSFINFFIYLYCLVDNALKMGGYKHWYHFYNSSKHDLG